MNCKYFTIRTKNYKKYKFCRLKKQVIQECDKNCSDFILKTNKGIKNKSNKLKQLEQNRKSILTNDLEHCYVCRNKKEDIHEVFGGSNRIRSMQNGFCVPLCRRCHQDEVVLKLLQLEMQKKYLENHTEDEFIKIIGKLYI